MLHHFKQLLPAPILPHPKYLFKKHLYFNIFDYFQDEKASQIHAGGIEYRKESLVNQGFFVSSLL